MKNFLTENNKAPIADLHAIVTDHPRMRELGLGVFTTGDLNVWLNNLKQPHPAAANPMPKEFYGNWTAINHSTIDRLLGTHLKSSDGWGGFEGWRRHGSTGKYEHQEWDNWSWSILGFDGLYTQADLLFDTFWSQADGGLFTDLHPVSDTITGGWNAFVDEPTAFGRNFFLGVTSPILQIIEMNSYMNQIKRVFPRTEWVDSPDADLTAAKLFAMDSFLTDIKSSKLGCIEFSGEVPFNINIADGGISCVKTDMVKYKLYLYDDSKVRSTDKVAVLKDPKIGGYKRDTLGRPYRNTADGEVIDANTSNPADQSVGELERNWNPYTMKWESGTQNVFAKVVTHVNAAVNNPSVESLEDSDIKADLDGDETRHFAPSSGLVMPIEIQNANPMQWQPNYARTSGCRDQEKEKATLVGFNYNPLKSYPRDTLVMLSKIGGIWHITDMGSGISEEDKPVEAIFEGKWQFQYLATNSNSFFTGYTDKTKPKTSILRKVDPEFVERAFHRDYYMDDPLNGGADVNVDTNDYTDLEKGLVGGEPEILWSKKGVERFYATRGWWQFTSFDFMDSLIGGTHNANYIASTNCQTDSAGREVEAPPNEAVNGGGTGGFFGCVFPEGYRLNSTSTYFGGGRNFIINPRSAYHHLAPSDAIAYADKLLNSSDLGSDPNIEPFIDPAPDYRFLDSSGKWDGKYTPERSRQRRTLGTDPLGEIDFTEGQGNFQSQSPHYAPSMFFGETHDSRRDLKQLPADIGTLSSPSGRHGCPIQNIHALDVLHGDKIAGTLRDAVPDIFKERYWLYRADLPGTAADMRLYDDDLSSAYGFKPKTTNKIMFRPLKVGTYAQYFPSLDMNRFSDGNSWRMTRDSWSAEVVRQFHIFPQNGEELLMASPASRSRELSQILSTKESFRAGGVPSKVSANTLLHSSQKGLLLRGDIHPQGNSTNSTTLSTSDFNYPGYSARVHDNNFWNKDIFNTNTHYAVTDGLTQEDRGANAFGVIGAVATTAANNQIAFSTQNRLGMMCESRRTIGTSYLKPAWGGSSTSYNTNKTTELWATVYHAHPRSQTIYDPRYFAVHHFNPEVYNASSSVKGVETRFQQRQGENIVEIKNRIHSRAIMWNDDGTVIQDDDGLYTIDRANQRLEHDLIEPTRFGPDGLWAITCDIGDKVFKDLVTDMHLNGLSALHQEVNWNINTQRTAKLLPFRYRTKVLGVPWLLGVTIDITDLAGPVKYSVTLDPNGADKAYLLADKMIIRDRGKGYHRGDIIGNEGLNIRFSVESVETINDADGNPVAGVIKELKLYSQGNVNASVCSDSSRQILPNKVSGYTLKNIAAAGSGFSAFFVNAVVSLETRIDHKPRVVDTNGRSFRLSSAPDGSSSQAAQNTRQDPILDLGGIAGLFGLMGGGGSVTTNKVGRDYGIIYGGVDTALIISPEQRSPDRKYDIFFHFHNDISHTWMDPGYGDVFNPYDVDENHITTHITAY